MEMQIHEKTKMAIEGRKGKHGNIILKGPKGMGKYHVGRILAASELGCTEDELATSAYYEIKPIKGIISSEVIAQIDENTSFAINKRYVVLIDDADRLDDASQNRLLKMLEDNTDRVSYILICHTTLLDTIVSRCVTIDFPMFTNEELAQWMKEHSSYNELAVLGCHGTPGTYLKLVNSKEYMALMTRVVELINNSATTNIKELFEITGNKVEGDKNNIIDNFDSDYIISFLESFYQFFLSDIKKICMGDNAQLTYFGRNYSSSILARLALETSCMMGRFAVGKANKDDFFTWLIYVMSPELLNSKERVVC